MDMYMASGDISVCVYAWHVCTGASHSSSASIIRTEVSNSTSHVFALPQYQQLDNDR